MRIGETNHLCRISAGGRNRYPYDITVAVRGGLVRLRVRYVIAGAGRIDASVRRETRDVARGGVERLPFHEAVDACAQDHALEQTSRELANFQLSAPLHPAMSRAGGAHNLSVISAGFPDLTHIFEVWRPTYRAAESRGTADCGQARHGFK